MTNKRMAAINRKTRILLLVRDHPELTHGDVARLTDCSRKYVSNVARGVGIYRAARRSAGR